MKKAKWIINIIIAILAIALIFISVKIVRADELAEEPIWTNKMIALHNAAESLRALGYSDNDPVIRTLSEAWWNEYHDFCIIAKVIEGEACGCEWDQMVYVGAVILNRVHSGLFHGTTVEEIVASPNQYSLDYLKNFHTIQPRVWKAAKAAMDGNHDAPEDLYWQAEFPQGKEVWKVFKYESKWYCSTTYFCRGTIYD